MSDDSDLTDPKYGQGYTIGVNYVPNVIENWPNKGTPGYICGTVPYNNAPCLKYASSYLQSGRSNVDSYGPSTFASCCDGPIINITNPITDPSNPSYGATCLAYCPVDFGRTLTRDNDGSFGDYWNCVTNKTGNSDDIYGSITCGWVGTSEHDKCEISISAEKTNTGAPSITMYPFSQANRSSLTTAWYESKTYASCPAQTTSGVYTTSNSEGVATPTPTGSVGSHLEAPGVGVGSVVGLALVLCALFGLN